MPRAEKPLPAAPSSSRPLPKAPTGIGGFDDLTEGGVPKGRTTLLCGNTGCGKTIFAAQFLVNGIRNFGENGVFVSFEEAPEDLEANLSSLGFGLGALQRKRKLAVEYVHLDKHDLAVSGSYNLDGLFIRLEQAIAEVKAKRVAIDTLDSVFGAFESQAILRSEIARLFAWFKKRGLTVLITGERGPRSLTRHGLEEYVSDCVVLLDHRVRRQISTRLLRIVKYRGSMHGTNEYPFLIDVDGISVMPLSSLGMEHKAPLQRVSTGIPKLDGMFGGEGYYRGSTILVTGTAGSGKTSLANHFADAACRRGEKVLYFSFEESQEQIVRNMRSIGLKLSAWIKSGKLEIRSIRPAHFGLEMHLVHFLRIVKASAPSIVIIDPISNLTEIGERGEIHSVFTRLIDCLKTMGITTFLTHLAPGGTDFGENTDIGISSLIDTWLLVRDLEQNGERNRGLYILKSRGMTHSNQIREFTFSEKGIDLIDPYVGPSGVLTGSARLAQEARERAEALKLRLEIEGMEIELDRKRRGLEDRIAALESDARAQEQAMLRDILIKKNQQDQFERDRSRMAESRKAAQPARLARG